MGVCACDGEGDGACDGEGEHGGHTRIHTHLSAEPGRDGVRV